MSGESSRPGADILVVDDTPENLDVLTRMLKQRGHKARRVPPDLVLLDISEIARSHHKRFDDSGYPDAPAGEAIPLSARIVAVADQYDALRNTRPYKPAFDATKTYSIITQGDGRSDPRHLDPRVLAAFVAIAGEFDAIYEELRE